MNILVLAYAQVKKEKKLGRANAWDLILDRAIQIRHYLDIQNRSEKVAQSRYGK